MQILSISSDATSLTVDYNVNDPYGVYGMIYMLVYESSGKSYESGATYTIPVSASESQVRITKYTSAIANSSTGEPTLKYLDPDTQYTVMLGYYSGSSSESTYTYQDVMRATTSAINSSVKFSSLTSTSVTGSISLDSSYSMSAVQVVWYGDGTTLSTRSLSSAEIAQAKASSLTLSADVGSLTSYGKLKMSILVRYNSDDTSYTELDSVTITNPYYAVTASGLTSSASVTADEPTTSTNSNTGSGTTNSSQSTGTTSTDPDEPASTNTAGTDTPTE